MSPTPKQVQQIFVKISALPPEQRQAALEDQCANQPELAARVAELLAAHGAADSFLDDTADGFVVRQLLDTGATEGMVIAQRYTLRERIGEGGMGEVWVAKQTEPIKRRVAMKLIKAGMDSRAMLSRFEQERQALAMMDHPNIARVLDGGLTPTGQPFFVMELVNGLPLTQFCDEAKLSLQQRLEIFVPICQAVQHAHQKGIVHRDLKPANILVTMVDGRPVPKIIDFGLAKAISGNLTDQTLTQFGAVLGTLEYMSPEQASFSGTDVDTRADIYSLGVILYEMLTGLKPIDRLVLQNAALIEMIRIIREEEPSKPSKRLSTDAMAPSMAALRQTEPQKLTALLRGELDWVVMKCLEKQRERRYETANALARDIQRYLADEVVEARPPSWGYGLTKFVRRHRGQVVAAGLVLIVLVAGICGTSWGLFWALRESDAKGKALAAETAERKRAEKAEQEVRRERDAKTEALAAEEQARQQTLLALRSLTDRVVERHLAAGQGRMLSDDDKQFLLVIARQWEAFATLTRENLESRSARMEGRASIGKMRHWLGEFATAEEDFHAALTIGKQLATEFPDNTEIRHRLAATHIALGNVLNVTGRLDEAERNYDAAMEIGQRLVEDSPSNPLYLEDLAITHTVLGSLLETNGQLKEAIIQESEAVAILKPLTEEFPARAKLRQELAKALHSQARLLRLTGKRQKAEVDYQEALAVQGKLVIDFPNRPEFHQQLAKFRNNWGVLLISKGQMKQAKVEFDEARSIFRQLAAHNPTRPEYRQDLAKGHENCGLLILRSAGRTQDAKSEFDQAIAIFEQLAADFPNRPEFHENLASCYNSRGNLSRKSGNLDDATEDYTSALVIFRKMATDFPDQPDVRNDVAAACVNQALLHQQRGDFSAALDLLNEGQPHHLAALEANPVNATYRRFYRNHLGLLTQIHAALLEPEKAVMTATLRRDVGWDPPADAADAVFLLRGCIPIVADHDMLSPTERNEAMQFYEEAAKELEIR